MSAFSPSVSVIIPTYNRARFVPRAVASVLAQTVVEKIEVIVVDDGSTDRTEQVLAPYRDRIRYYKQRNQGVVAARNKGIDVANGTFIALLDSDDSWAPWKIETQLRCFEIRPGLQLLWTNATAVDDEGNFLYEDFAHTYYAYQYFRNETLFGEIIPIDVGKGTVPILASAPLGIGDLSSAMFMGNFVVTSSVLMRREAVEAAGRFDPAMGQAMEDYDLFWRICERGLAGFLDVPAVSMRRGGEDHLIAAQGRMAQSDLKALEKYLSRHPEGPRLDRRLVTHRLKEAYERVGIARFDEGDHGLARKYTALAMRHGSRRKRIYLYYLMSLLPPVAVRALRWLLRRARAFKARIRRP